VGRPPNLETGVIYCGDNRERMARLPAASVDLIYLDPPFFSNRTYEVIWGDEAEVRSFADRWEGGIQHYIGWMRDRAIEMRRVLKPDGVLFLHCDSTASHYLKVMLDDIFGMSAFRNEIIWKRTAVKGDARVRLGRVHDVILCYGGSSATFHLPTTEHSHEYRARFKFDDHDGRGPYSDAPLDSPSPRPNLTYEYEGHLPPANGWRVSRDEMERLHADNRLIMPRKQGARIRRKNYLSQQAGVPLGDVWTDIAPLNSQAAERKMMGYPTQKPEALLERLIRMSSNPGDVVLDPFCGCGTTISVAEKIGRRWIGIDISQTAVKIMDWRIKKIPGARWPKLIGLPSSVEDLRGMKPFEFQNWVIQQFFGVSSTRKSGDMGIDGYTFLTRDPIQVKRSDKVGRNVVDNFQTAVRRDGSTTGWIVAFSFTKDAREEAARARWEEKLEINLVTVADLLTPKSERRGPMWPEPATVTDIPLTPPRDTKHMSAEELVASARRERTA
jgi:DNA modification methylase